MNPISRRKIIIVGPAHPYRGGNALFVADLHDILQKSFDVSIYNYSLLYPSLLFPGVTQYDRSEKVIRPVPSRRLINSINPFNWVRVARRLRREKADLVIFDWWQPFFGPCHWTITRLIRRQYAGRLVFVTENVVSHEGRFIDRLLTRIGLANASSFIALSDQVLRELRSFSDQPVYRSELPVYSGSRGAAADADKQRELGLDDKDQVLLFFGYIRRYKGLDLLIRALPEIAAQLPRVRLLIVGEFYDKPERYLQLIDSVGVKSRVTLIDRYVANEEVAGYYGVADVVVLPYRSATQSGILNMAFGFGKPAVVTRVGGLAEFVIPGETGVVVEPDSPAALARGVIEFFRLRDRIDFSANVRARAEQNQFSRMPQLIQTILQSSGTEAGNG